MFDVNEDRVELVRKDFSDIDVLNLANEISEEYHMTFETLIDR